MDYEYIKQNASDLGKCGEHLHWYYLHETLYIGGEGEMTEFPWHKLYAGQIKYVYVGNGCVNVKRGAFHDCPCLKTVDIPESVKIIDAFAFRRCKNLQTVTLAEGLAEIKQYAFDQCESLSEIWFPKSLRRVGAYAFRLCSSLQIIKLPPTLAEKDHVFEKCDNVRTVWIPADGCHYEIESLKAFPNVEAYRVEEGNECLVSQDGVLYDREKKNLIAYPCQKKGPCQIAEGVLSIGRGAFALCKCYPHLGDFKSQHLAPQGLKRPIWRILDRLSGDLYVLSQTQNSIVRYAPLFIHSFVLCAPRKILEATQFNQRYRRYEEIESVPDRLRWC